VGKQMKIPGTGPVQATTARRRGQPARSSGAFAGELAADKGVKESAPAREVVSAGMLISAQEIGDPLDSRRRAVKRGEDILDQLDELRHGLLLGAYSSAKLDNLLVMIRRQQTSVTDPKLREILAEIEVRAAVELAKLGK
jgi:hypothetical protein